MKQDESTLNSLVIRHTLKALGSYSKAGENLLLLTIALQVKHPDTAQKHSLGLYRIDSATHLRIWDNYLAFDPDLASTVRGLASQKAFLQDPHLELACNLAYATAIAWMIYQNSGLKLPDADDVKQLSSCWAQHFSQAPNSEVPEPVLLKKAPLKKTSLKKGPLKTRPLKRDKIVASA